MCFTLNISEKLHWQHAFEILEEVENHLLYFVNTIQYPRNLNNNIYHSNKQEPPQFFHLFHH